MPVARGRGRAPSAQPSLSLRPSAVAAAAKTEPAMVIKAARPLQDTRALELKREREAMAKAATPVAAPKIDDDGNADALFGEPPAVCSGPACGHITAHV
jgi:hypothetical protein